MVNMKKSIKRTIALISAAAISVGTAIPAAAAERSCVSVQKIFSNSSCPSLKDIDIQSILEKYGKSFGQNIKPGCSGNICIINPGCSGGSGEQAPEEKPDCSGGSCEQIPEEKPDCSGENCEQTPEEKPDCSGGSCEQTPEEKPGCSGGSCEQIPAEKPGTSAEQEDYTVSEYEKEVVRLVNEIRAANGLTELTLNTKLSQTARIKAQDMKDNHYFSHNSPTYGTPFEMMKSRGITYRTAGENIAQGQKTPEEVVKTWMNSEGHRANILNASFKEIGMGYVSGGNYWVQMFIG